MRKFATTILLFMFTATPAVAAGFYAGVNLGIVNYNYTNITNNGQAGFGVLGGYTVNRHFAVEVEYDNLGGFDYSSGGTQIDSTVKGRSLGFSGVGFLPIDYQLSLFGKLGMASTTMKDSPLPGAGGGVYTYNSTGLTVGFGGQLSISPEASIRLGYDNYPITDSVSTSSVGILYVGGIFKF